MSQQHTHATPLTCDTRTNALLLLSELLLQSDANRVQTFDLREGFDNRVAHTPGLVCPETVRSALSWAWPDAHDWLLHN